MKAPRNAWSGMSDGLGVVYGAWRVSPPWRTAVPPAPPPKGAYGEGNDDEA